MQRDAALAMAESCRAALAPHCHRIEIAGSIRRRKPQVKDIELVALPKMIVTGLFEDELVVDPGFCRVVNRWRSIKGQPTGKYTQRRLPEGIVLDLFLADGDNWGLTLAVRTGSATFSHEILARRWVKAGYTSVQGHLYRGAVKVPIREEADLFKLLGIPWVNPEAREV